MTVVVLLHCLQPPFPGHERVASVMMEDGGHVLPAFGGDLVTAVALVSASGWSVSSPAVTVTVVVTVFFTEMILPGPGLVKVFVLVMTLDLVTTFSSMAHEVDILQVLCSAIAGTMLAKKRERTPTLIFILVRASSALTVG